MTMTFSHFSYEETITPYSVEQGVDTLKPRGLWVSVDGPDDWPSWCRAEEHGDIDAQQHFRVTIADGPLILDSAVGILALHDEFAKGGKFDYDRLDWARVAERWPGIIIAPYQWSIRMSGPLWYYGWDCASGCIWDASVITSVERVTEAVAS